MKAVLALAVFACVAAVTLADGYGYRPGFKRVYKGVQAAYNNADRQQYVNRRAEHVGASSGTARYDGVPGTGRNFGYYGYGHNQHNNGYGQDSYGYGYDRQYDGYGHDSHDNGYGYDRHH